MNQVQVYVKGEVIGVGFRAWTKIQAKIHHVTGWVRNRHDDVHRFGIEGGVEALLQGEQQDLEDMVNIIKEGSPVSRVDDVEVYWQKQTEIFEEFEIKK